MRSSFVTPPVFWAVSFLLGLAPQWADAGVNARLLRHPDVSATHITFGYAGDLWVVPKGGGTAHRLSSPPGEEVFPRFSPDGASIAFTANYDGNEEVYRIPAQGGLVERLTYHPAGDTVLDWYPDGESLLIASRQESETGKYSQFFRLSRLGGFPERLPVPFGEIGALSADGEWLAYTPRTVHQRTWKRHRGGTAPDLWLFNLKTYESRNLTQNPAIDEFPMWHGRRLYFLSDRGPRQRLNLWVHDLEDGSFRQVTQFAETDVHFPAIGPADIVFEAGGRLHLLDLATEEHHPLAVEVVTDLATLRPRNEKVSDLLRTATVSPSGRRVAVEARGEIFSLPAEHGVVLNLTRSAGVAELFPAWSPDGRQLAYVTDRNGEYQLAVRPADGTGGETLLTSYADGFRYQPQWSPDSQRLAFVDHAMQLQVFDLERKQVVVVDRLQWLYHSQLLSYGVSWSSDSRWLAYHRAVEDHQTAVFLFDTRGQEKHQVTSGYYEDRDPVFDPEGKYLYFLTGRHLEPLYDDLQNTWVYVNTTQIAAVPLRRDVESPLKARNDEEDAARKDDGKSKSDKPAAADGKPGAAATETKGASDDGSPSVKTDAEKAGKGDQKEGEGDGKKAPAPVDIHLVDFERRVVLLPPRPGQYGGLSAVEGRVVYRRQPNKGSAEERSPILLFDLKEREEKTVLADADEFQISADGKKVLARQKRSWALVDLKPDQKFDKTLATGDLEMTVVPRDEWRQIFRDAWRLNRDYFYDPGMHGLDWDRVRRDYAALLEDAVTREDVNFVIGEMIGELNASHTYRGGGDVESPDRRPVGLLGVDWGLEQGAFRIRRILRGAAWDAEVRSPFDEPGVAVEEGSFVLAVNGVPLDAGRSPWEAFAGLSGRTVQLTVNDRPSREGSRTVVVRTLTESQERRLRHLAWVEANRRRVDEATQGQVGYLYVPDTAGSGQTELVRQFRAQFDRPGLIIDERFNSGGQLGDRFLELLSRRPFTYLSWRHGRDLQWPPVGHFGPQVMLINEWSGSGGDAFPWFFKTANRGPIVGQRTWGGLIGPAMGHQLIDGGTVVVPPGRLYGPDGEWFAEGHGVDPDIAVPEDPTALARGRDVQLERAIEEVQRLLREHPPVVPDRPAYQYRGWPRP